MATEWGSFEWLHGSTLSTHYVHLSYLFGDSESSLLVIAGEQHNPNSHPLESSYCRLRLVFNCVCYSHHSHK